MTAKVLAVWLDGAEPTLLEEMMDRGELPVLAGLRARGTYGRLVGPEHSGTETSYGQGEVLLALNGNPLPERRRRLREGILTQVLLARDFAEAPEHWLRLETAPIDTSAWTSPDPRRLGMPVFGVTFEPLTGWLSRVVARLR